MSYDLAVLIPARNEMFLCETVKNVLGNIRGNTEVIVVLDGEWANPPLTDAPNLTIVYHHESVGQRAATNEAARLTDAKYLMKLDAHCVVDEGFDIKMMEQMSEDITMIPVMYNLHAFDWVCVGTSPRSGNLYHSAEELKERPGCGNRLYQGPTPEKCEVCGGNMERELVFKPRLNRRSDFYRFDTTLHFQYHGDRKNYVKPEDVLVETMSAQGSCFMLTAKKYWELDICEENFGSWGQQGTEVACKTWLSGGRVVTNRNTWYSHMFRTQGKDFGFPYPLSGSQVDHARKYSRDLFFENTWKGQIYPLSWLIEKFKPLPDWHGKEFSEVLTYVHKRGEDFYKRTKFADVINQKPISGDHENGSVQSIHMTEDHPNPLHKGIIFYTDNQLQLKIAHAVQKNLKKISKDKHIPIVSASLKPMDFGENIHLPLKRGYLTMALQILAALERTESEIIYFCEHDILYHPSHFDFVPAKKDTYYYNTNVWKVRSSDGHALHYDCQQLSGLVAYRDLLLEHFRERVRKLEEYLKILTDAKDKDCESEFNKYVRSMGFEPGTHNRPERVDDYKAESFVSKFPNIDIRHDGNLTPSRWNKGQFRNQKYTIGWTEGDITRLPGWDFTTNIFAQ